MKILMVLDHNFPPDIRVEKEIKSLIKEGHKIILACYDYKLGNPSFEKKEDLIIYRKSISTFIYKSSVGILKFPFYFNFWKKFISAITKIEKIDAIHIHDLPLAKIGAIFKKKLNIPFILDLHENWSAYLRISTHANTLLGKLLSSNRKWNAYEKKSVFQADHIITVIEEARERIINLKVNNQKVHVVSNTTEIGLIPKQKSKSKKFILFYAGGITYHRGLQDVIKAIPLVKDKIPDFVFQIVGDGSYKDQLIELARTLNVEKEIEFTGYMPFKEMFNALSHSQIAIIPHHVTIHTNSTIPNKIFEYMYNEKPIISSNCKPIARIINETETGLIYQDNEESLAECILKLYQNSTLRDSYGKNGIKWFSEKYNWSYDEKKLINIYNLVE